MNTTRWLATPLILGLLVGCSKTEPPKAAPAATEPAATGAAATPAPAAPATAKPEMARPDAATAVVKETPKPAAPPKPATPPPAATAAIQIPNTPDGTVLAVIHNITDNKPQVLWESLPKKYQADVKDVLAEFAGKVDKDVWDKSFAVLGKLTRLAKEKKTFILAQPMLAMSGPVAANKDKVEKNWDSVVGVFDILLTSEIKSVDGLQKLDPGKFLSGTCSKWLTHLTGAAAKDADLAQALAKAKNLKVTVVESSGDTATIRLEPEGEEPKERQMKRVDGKWLPAEVADGWEEAIAKAKDGIATMSFTGEQKTQAMTMLAMVDGILDQLLAAKTQEEFDAAVAGVVGMLGGGAGAGAPPKIEPPKLNDN